MLGRLDGEGASGVLAGEPVVAEGERFEDALVWVRLVWDEAAPEMQPTSAAALARAANARQTWR
jgi:hypothetical protein